MIFYYIIKVEHLDGIKTCAVHRLIRSFMFFYVFSWTPRCGLTALDKESMVES